MIDKEALEFAAKAYGLSPDEQEWPIYDDGSLRSKEIGAFRPDIDDGDALRLAVRLQLTVCNEQLSCGCAYCTRSGEEISSARSAEAGDQVGHDDYIATRQAIVMAAASIGKAIP